MEQISSAMDFWKNFHISYFFNEMVCVDFNSEDCSKREKNTLKNK